MLPPIVFARVAVSLCPSALLAHVALECPSRTRNPCVQQYPPGVVGRAVVGRVAVSLRRGCCVAVPGGADVCCNAAKVV
jgi:hypothetical protein